MHDMNTDKTDLSFLFLMEAMLDERSVSGAAERLGLSQPAMSHAVARMRKRFNDPLFVKTKAGMQPTPVAQRIGSASKKVLALVRDEVLGGDGFSPSISARTFTLGLSDMAATVVLHRVAEAIATQAPLAKLRVVNVLKEDIPIQLETGEIDLVIGTHPMNSPAVLQKALFKATAHVGIVRAGHPRIQGRLTLSQFVETPQVLAAQSSEANAFIDQRLRARGLTRRIAVEVPYLLPLPNVVAHSDYLAVVPGALATLSHKFTALQILDLPIRPPTPIIKQYWHKRFAADQSVTWLRGALSTLWLNG